MPGCRRDVLEDAADVDMHARLVPGTASYSNPATNSS